LKKGKRKEKGRSRAFSPPNQKEKEREGAAIGNAHFAAGLRGAVVGGKEKERIWTVGRPKDLMENEEEKKEGGTAISVPGVSLTKEI